MREILFRGKRIDNGEWVCSGNLIHFNEDDQYFIANLNDKCISTHDENDHIIAIEDTRIYKVVPETVGQYTGLTDKNGKKIFEGDIVKYGDTIHKVVFEQRNGTAYFGLIYSEIETLPFGHYQDLKQITIIGNTHDNPELLKEGENG